MDGKPSTSPSSTSQTKRQQRRVQKAFTHDFIQGQPPPPSIISRKSTAFKSPPSADDWQTFQPDMDWQALRQQASVMAFAKHSLQSSLEHSPLIPGHPQASEHPSTLATNPMVGTKKSPGIRLPGALQFVQPQAINNQPARLPAYQPPAPEQSGFAIISQWLLQLLGLDENDTGTADTHLSVGLPSNDAADVIFDHLQRKQPKDSLANFADYLEES